ncbi:Sb31 domain protein [Klebsiella oxytoca]|nr:Sb31 domain protein [Klebsiella oxytoca]
MKDKLLIIRNQLKMGHRLSFAEAMILQRAIDVFVCQAGNSPVIPDGLIAAVNRLLDSDGSRGCYSAIRCGDAHDEIERLLASAPQEVQGE